MARVRCALLCGTRVLSSVSARLCGVRVLHNVRREAQAGQRTRKARSQVLPCRSKICLGLTLIDLAKTFQEKIPFLKRYVFLTQSSIKI